MSKIWEKDRRYAFLRPWVDACTRASYSRLKVEGRLPDEGAVIIAPNHSNTLMDALVVLASRRAQTVFGARADIFRKPTAAMALRFLKILPLARERDGAGTIRDSIYAFDEIDGTLEAGIPFCLFAEGRHRTERTILPLQKGIARIALRSARQRPTVIVPAGINYSDFFHYRGRCLLRYGEPLDVNAFLSAHGDAPEGVQQQLLREELGRRIQDLVLPDGLPRPSRWRLILLPLWPVAAVLSLPMWGTAEFICNRVVDRAFHNTVRYGVRLLLTPVNLLIWALVFFFTLPWWLAAALCVLSLCSYSLFYDGWWLFSRNT